MVNSIEYLFVLLIFLVLVSGNGTVSYLFGSKVPPLSPPSRSLQRRGIKIAYCLTGQLARLELESKIRNVLMANARAGNTPHLFVLLDNEIENVKQTYWKFNYSDTVFGAFSRQDLKAFVDQTVIKSGFDSSTQIRTRVILQQPSRAEFHVVNDKVPVRPKAFSGHDGPKDNYEPAESRFQNNMRWMSGILGISHI